MADTSGPGGTTPGTGPRQRFSFGTVPQTPEESRAFLQHRLALLGKWTFLLTLASFVVTSTVFLAIIHAMGVQWAPEPLGFIPLLISLKFAALWAVCGHRRIALPHSLLLVIDAGMAFGLGAGFSLASSSVPMPAPWLIAVVAFTQVAFMRTVFIPSTAARTAWISAVACAPVITAAYLHAQWHPAPPLDPALHLNPALHLSPALATGFATVFCAMSIVVAATASHLIYGLRQKAREAAQLGQYTLLEKIGEGGMGAVYKARHALLRRPTAIKLLLPGHTGERDLARFEQEVQLTSQLTHQNTIAIYDYGHTPDGVFYYAMEYLEGVTLEDLVEAEGHQPPGRVIHVLAQVCGALAEAHAIGLIHRDVKPANILLCERGGVCDVVKVVDFGLVKDMRGGGGPGLSVADTLTGTPFYLSPEAIRSPEGIDARADLYAVGAVGYFLLTGKVVFEGTSIIDVCSQHLHAAPVPPSERLGDPLPDDLSAVILRCLQKDRAARPMDALALRDALLRCRDAGSWAEEEARAWWELHRARTGEREDGPGERPAKGARQVSIDVRGRIHGAG